MFKPDPYLDPAKAETFIEIGMQQFGWSREEAEENTRQLLEWDASRNERFKREIARGRAEFAGLLIQGTVVRPDEA